MRKLIYITAILCACRPLEATSTNQLVIEVAAPPPNVQLGFGWHRPERNSEFSFVWINRLEADLWIILDLAPASEIEIKAVPFYLKDRRQSIGLYVNERFIAEWVCSYRTPWLPDSYTAPIPEGVFKVGKNRLTLRMGYLAENKDNQHALAVNSIILRRP